MMSKTKHHSNTLRRLLALTLAVITALGLTSCSSIKDSMGGGVEITESAYIVDKETGDYRALLIAENNGDSVMKEIVFSADGYDADGNRIELVEHEEEDGAKWHQELAASCYLLGPGQKTAYVASNLDTEENDLQSCYKTIPDKLEWLKSSATVENKRSGCYRL